MISRIAVAMLLGCLLLSASACMKSENTVTWFVDPSGLVTWSIMERNAHSDSKDRQERDAEESQFIAAARGRQHPAATGLARMSAGFIKATILHDKPPFTILTEGQMPALDVLGRRFMATYGMTGTSLLTRDGEKWVWTWTIDSVPAEPASDQDAAELTALLGDHLRVALRDGEFVEASGFSIEDDGRTAELKGDVFDERGKDDPPRVLKLVWK
jgi:hypothetical protein